MHMDCDRTLIARPTFLRVLVALATGGWLVTGLGCSTAFAPVSQSSGEQTLQPTGETTDVPIEPRSVETSQGTQTHTVPVSQTRPVASIDPWGGDQGDVGFGYATIPATTSPIKGSPLDMFGELPVESFAPSWPNGLGDQANVTRVSFNAEGADFDPQVTLDGTAVVFASTRHSTHADIYYKTLDSKVVTQLTTDPSEDVMPSLSPDGTRLAFASNRRGNWDIFVMPSDGGRPVQVTSSEAHEIHPSWSPDGTKLVFSRLGEVTGAWELWVAEVDNPAVAHFIGHGLFPQWCPKAGTGAGNRDQIVYQRSRERGDRAFSIWTIDYKSGQARNQTEIASSSQAAFINPTWSPDGQNIVFASVPNPNQWARDGSSRPQYADLWLVSIDGNTRVNLTEGQSVSLMPTWGPNNKILYVSDRAGTDNLWSMDLGRTLVAAARMRPEGYATTKKQEQGSKKADEAVATVPEN